MGNINVNDFNACQDGSFSRSSRPAARFAFRQSGFPASRPPGLPAFRLAAFLMAGLGLLAACSGKAPAAAPAGSGKPAMAVETAAVHAQDVTLAVDVVGTLDPKYSADIKSEINGLVSEVDVAEWVHVTKGQPLAKLDTRELEADIQGARAAVLQAQVGSTRAQREWERAQKLKEAGLLTQQGLDDAASAREAAEASVSAAKAQLSYAETRLAKCVIRAPMDGVIARRGVSAGSRVENMGGSPMFTIVDNRLFDLTVTVPSSRIEEVRVGQPLSFTTDALAGRTFEGHVAFINPSAEGTSRAVKVVAEVPNPDGALKSGLFVKGRIITSVRAAVLQVSRAALLSWDVAAQTGELFIIEGGVAHRRTIRTGAAFDDSIEVTEGLKAGDVVATRGAFNLQDGDTVSAVKPGA
jgi:membrane fusion protein, multidrug efflux system